MFKGRNGAEAYEVTCTGNVFPLHMLYTRPGTEYSMLQICDINRRFHSGEILRPLINHTLSYGSSANHEVLPFSAFSLLSSFFGKFSRQRFKILLMLLCAKKKMCMYIEGMKVYMAAVDDILVTTCRLILAGVINYRVGEGHIV